VQKLLGLTPDADDDETRPSFADLSRSEIVLPGVAADRVRSSPALNRASGTCSALI
jgi:hypothetical protein